MGHLPLPTRKPYSLPSREWDYSLIDKGLRDNREEMMACLVNALAFIRRHHRRRYEDWLSESRRAIDGRVYHKNKSQHKPETQP